MGQVISRLCAEHSFPLLALPIEIQLLILEKCFEAQLLQARYSFFRGRQIKGLPDSKILLTCHYLNQIGCPILDRIFDGRLEVVGHHQPCLCIALGRIFGWKNPSTFRSHSLRIQIQRGILYDMRRRIRCVRVAARQLMEDVWVLGQFSNIESVEIICDNHTSSTEPPISCLSEREERTLQNRMWRFGPAEGVFYFLYQRRKNAFRVDNCCFRIDFDQEREVSSTNSQ